MAASRAGGSSEVQQDYRARPKGQSLGRSSQKGSVCLQWGVLPQLSPQKLPDKVGKHGHRVLCGCATTLRGAGDPRQMGKIQ